MAQEIEVKLRVDEHETVRQRLRERSATLMGRVLETNVILDRADGSLRGDGCGLRVRSAVAQTDGTTIATVTFKGRVVPSRFKSRTELEIAVDNADTAIAMLDALGPTGSELLATIKATITGDIADSWLTAAMHRRNTLGAALRIEGLDDKAIKKITKG
ncbi:MAG: class IV adenylate cyclase, partial [Proteobacteria bacterium]|nr:class IV adenylate cyclase [Pseudomonadota bacterium]